MGGPPGNHGQAPFCVLAFGQLLQGPGRLVVQPVVFEEDAHVPPGLALGLGLADPGRFLQHDRLEVLVLLQRAVQGGRAPPLLEDAMDLRIAVGDVPGQGVGIQAIERLLVALVGIFHEVGQGHDRVPRRVRDHLHRQALALQGLRLARFQQAVELELLGLRAADGQRQRFGDQRAADEHRQQALLAVGDPAGRADGLVADRPAGGMSGTVSRQEKLCDSLAARSKLWSVVVLPEVGVDRFAGAGVGEAQPHRAALPGRRLVADLDGELQLVAFAEEPRRIGLDHEVLGGDRFVGQAGRRGVGRRGRSPGTSTWSGPRAW